MDLNREVLAALYAKKKEDLLALNLKREDLLTLNLKREDLLALHFYNPPKQNQIILIFLSYPLILNILT